ncbi:ADP-ribosylglycohydrolase family protein [Microbacterium sp. SORGH_AS_0862]|uniref:ADP-ribosylglycohydrolase family protein n=1 Tax=Microbacterium sp. SORGH_AS_0862 TaxID=3041789 RepID=UPI00278DD48F|nr:ADP-ribosylglycohydrolase family protein [Microbacterium sp. SORGH_AS_0862]MDQ1204492.1 ADP-ribosylglycohydrolase [Microbacterium sp. SORGH_AS_0862]
MTYADRTRGCLIALAAGDALGAPTEGMTREGIAAAFGRVETFLTADAAGTDDTEYAVLTAQAALAHGSALTSDDVADLWLRALAMQDGGFSGAGFSEMVALAGLASGLRPPHSGRRSYERWSDGAAMRVAPLGLLCPGDPTEAARLAAIDAVVSHSDDGVLAAQTVAAAIASGAGGAGWEAALAAGLAAIPTDSWTARGITHALELVDAAPDAEHAERMLSDALPLRHYPWADAAPEAVAFTFGLIAAHRGHLQRAVLAGVNMGRDSDTIAAMAGAICGAVHGMAAVPPGWADRVRRVAGVCITATRGVDLMQLADRLAEAAHAR